MIIRKLLIGLFSFALLFTVSIPTSAYEKTTVGNGLYAKESIATEIQSKMFAEDESSYSFLFGTNDVTFEFDRAMPFYVLNYSESIHATTAADMLEYADYYIVPVLDKNKKFIAFAEFKQIAVSERVSEILKLYSEQGYEKEYNDLLDKCTNHLGEWEIIGSSTGGYTEEFYEFIKSDNTTYKQVMSYEQAYLTEDNSGYNILLISENEEQYFSFYKYLNSNSTFSVQNNNIFISGNELLKEAQKQYESYVKTEENASGTAGDNVTDDFPGEEEVVFSEKEKLDTNEFEVEVPAEEQNETPANNKDSIPEGVLTDGREFIEVENPKTGSSNIFTAIIAVGTIGISLFFIGKKN